MGDRRKVGDAGFERADVAAGRTPPQRAPGRGKARPAAVMLAPWAWSAVAGQVAFASATYIDRAARARRGSSPDAVVAGSAVVYLALGAVWLLVGGTAELDAATQVALVAAGALLYLHLVPYGRALRGDDARVVGPMFQLVPVFVLALSWSLLGQRLGDHQVVGFVVVFVGAAMFMHGDARGRLLVKQSTAWLMILASALLASQITLLGRLLETHQVVDALPLLVVGMGVAGAASVGVQPAQRSIVMRLDAAGWLRAALVSALVVVGEAFVAHALASGPVAGVAATAGIEAPCLMLIGAVATRVRPVVRRRRPDFAVVLLRACSVELLIGGIVLLGR